MRTRTHSHLSEWAALVGEKLPEELATDADGRNDLDEPKEG